MSFDSILIFNVPDPGFEEKRSGGRGYYMTVFIRERDPKKELWDGPLTGIESAASLLGADEARSITRFSPYLKSLCASASSVYIDLPKKYSGRRKMLLGYFTDTSTQIADSVLDFLPLSKVKPLSRELHNLRRTKSEAELRLMRKAASISGSAHAKVNIP